MTDWNLKKLHGFAGVPGPVLVCVMDGVGIGAGNEGDAVWRARTPTLDALAKSGVVGQLSAHGKAVGMPSDGDMGNSEVGHNALGSGRTFDQGAKLVDQAIASGGLYEGQTWQALVRQVVSLGSTMHFVGLLSDGNVHSHIDHLIAMLERADAAGVKSARVHVLLDGRDVSETSALQYVDQLEQLLGKISQASARDYRVASGGGRMTTTMDRYGADWAMVERGWKTHVHGEGPAFVSARVAVETMRQETPGVVDQNLGAFVIADAQGAPVGAMADGDAVVLFNFRGDRSIELCQAFEQDDFSAFDRGRRPDVLFCSMMEYDADQKIPARYLVQLPLIDCTLGEYLVRNSITQLAVSETQKFGHVTYFWNGNRSGKFDDALETYVEIPSDNISFDERPRMKAEEITDAVIAELRTGNFRTGRLNYANGDMVGHTGNLDASVLAVETVDQQVARLLPIIKELKGALIVTADHGNADEMFELGKAGQFALNDTGNRKAKTSHTLNPVPLYLYVPGHQLRLRTDLPQPRLANVAATTLQLLGLQSPADFEPGLIDF